MMLRIFDGNWSLGSRPDKDFYIRLFFCMCVVIKSNAFTMTIGPSLPALFVPQWTITDCKLPGKLYS